MWRWEQLAEFLVEPKFGAELGVKEGRFTSYMLERFPSLHMFAIDLWSPRCDPGRQGFETYEEWDFPAIEADFHSRTWHYVNRLTLLKMDTREAAVQVPDGCLDFVFIDAEHTYEGVKGDIAAWLPKLRSGGILSGHDYYEPKWPGVVQAVNEIKTQVFLGADKVWMTRI